MTPSFVLFRSTLPDPMSCRSLSGDGRTDDDDDSGLGQRVPEDSATCLPSQVKLYFLMFMCLVSCSPVSSCVSDQSFEREIEGIYRTALIS